MTAILVAAAVGLLLTLLGTPLLIRFLHKREYGQFIRQDGPQGHFTKRGTPTMGGLVIILATVLGYGAANLIELRTPRASGILLLFLIVGLGLIGLLDDGIKIFRQRSLGLHAGAKIIGQILVAAVFAGMSLLRPNAHGITPGSLAISFARPTAVTLAFAGLTIGVILYFVWTNFIVAAWSNAVNLTDGLDGLATGASIFVFGAYTFITYFQRIQSCYSDHANLAEAACYMTRDPMDLAVFSAALIGSLAGFLWWNASPARIFMGDTGSLALGGAVAGLSILTNTEFLAIIIGGLFVVITMSDVIQILVFKKTRKRVFRMAPLHHHFELKGWQEVTIVIRFWLIAALFAITGAGVFYAEWVSKL